MNKVIARRNLPIKLPLTQTLVLWLLLDKLQAPGFVWGVVGALFLLVWTVAIVSVVTERQIDVLKGRK